MTAPTQAPPEAAATFYEQGQAITAAVLLAMQNAWPQFDPRNIDASFARLLAALVGSIASGQVAAARTATAYVPRLLQELGVEAPAVARPRPVAFIGASSGVTLPQMLDTARLRALSVAAGGAGPDVVAASTLSLVQGMGRTQVADAARQATAVEMAARPAIKGYVRVLNPPACSRCVLLAGREYRWNAGFQRHPGCDCRHLPVTVAADQGPLVDPRAYFDSLPRAEQDRVFTAAGAEAIREGADVGRVVNARSGMTTAQVGGRSVRATTVGTGRRRRRPLRLLPESIFDLADGDRNESIRLLRANGYIN